MLVADTVKHHMHLALGSYQRRRIGGRTVGVVIQEGTDPVNVIYCVGFPMTLDYDRENDSLYIYLREGVQRAYGESLDDVRYVDFGADGLPVGVELLRVSRGVKLEGLPEAQAIADLLYRRNLAVV